MENLVLACGMQALSDQKQMAHSIERQANSIRLNGEDDHAGVLTWKLLRPSSLSQVEQLPGGAQQT
ncbi:hypothetical protein GC1_06280 [Leisingera sp. ANG1]|nr:hypothetical protein RA21_08565 [Leisingera sp. ANG-DT]KIC23941.1 hypothetical protein RA23_12700 [Leisingera sp. ANG-S3]KIC53978.1 hypothetical protein RA22_07830 [Leisingera sp. ANG-S]KID09609.1 hypothetical protein GC1_06280 [Leisingera sp. ANG1]